MFNSNNCLTWGWEQVPSFEKDKMIHGIVLIWQKRRRERWYEWLCSYQVLLGKIKPIWRAANCSLLMYLFICLFITTLFATLNSGRDVSGAISRAVPVAQACWHTFTLHRRQSKMCVCSHTYCCCHCVWIGTARAKPSPFITMKGMWTDLAWLWVMHILNSAEGMCVKIARKNHDSAKVGLSEFHFVQSNS